MSASGQFVSKYMWGSSFQSTPHFNNMKKRKKRPWDVNPGALVNMINKMVIKRSKQGAKDTEEST